jgi:thiamine biosynthesis lipoprotein
VLRSLAALAFLLALVPNAGSSAEAPAALRSQGSVLGTPFEIEVRDLDRPAAEAAITQAFAAAARLEGEAAALARLTGGGGEVALGEAAFELLQRARALCRWSDGAVGPLGGPLFRLWGLTERAPGRPGRAALDAAVAAGRCDRLTLDAERRSARLAEGAELHLFPFAQGWAADALAEALRTAGADNSLVRVGVIRRAAGGGPEGRGWPVEPPAAAGAADPVATIYLRDRALALLSPDDRPLAIGGERFPPYLDLSTGAPAEGVVQVLVVAERALDAHALGYALFALGPRRGQFRLGGLEPPPAVLWQLGRGEGEPLLAESSWWTVPKR